MTGTRVAAFVFEHALAGVFGCTLVNSLRSSGPRSQARNNAIIFMVFFFISNGFRHVYYSRRVRTSRFMTRLSSIRKCVYHNRCGQYTKRTSTRFYLFITKTMKTYNYRGALSKITILKKKNYFTVFRGCNKNSRSCSVILKLIISSEYVADDGRTH